MITEIGFAVLIGIILWLVGAWIHHLPTSGTIQLPVWLARICGSRSNQVDPRMFSIQVLGLGIMLWLVFVALTDPYHEQREIVIPGCLTLIVIMSIISVVLSRFAKRN